MASVGLVLSGGMAKGAYQLGALRAVSEYFSPEEFTRVSCSSVGTLNGYAFAMRRLEQAQEMWLSLCDTTLRQSIGRVLRSSFLQRSIRDLCCEEDRLSVCVSTTLLDIGKRQLSYFDLRQAQPGTLPLYLKASVAMPVYNRPVILGENAYFDGAMVDNIPVYPLLADPPDYIICIYFDHSSYLFENELFDRRVIKLTFPAENRLKDSVVFQKSTIERMIRQGYEDTLLVLHGLLCGGKDDLPRIYRGIEALNRRMPAPSVRLTGDVLVTNLNRVAAKLTHRKLI